MQAEIRENEAIKESWSVIHPLTSEDSVAMTALRSAVVAMKGKLEGVAARRPFNGIMERGAPPDAVSFKARGADSLASLHGDHERRQDWPGPKTKMQNTSPTLPTPPNSGTFGPFRLRVVFEAA
jgi:hypothetical protein